MRKYRGGGPGQKPVGHSPGNGGSGRPGPEERREPAAMLRYAAAVAAVAIVVALRLAAWPILGDTIPYIPFAPALVAVAWYGGFGPGILATILSCLATDWILLEPYGTLALDTPVQIIGIGVLVVSGCLISLLVEMMRAAQRDAAESARVVQFQASILSQLDDAVVAIDNAGRITYWSAPAERMFGLSAAEALGLPLEDACRWEWLRPEEEQQAHEAMAARGSWRGVLTLIATDGRQTHVEASVMAVRDPKGEPVGRLAVLRDVSERIHAEEARRESEEREHARAEVLRAVMDAAPAGIILAEPPDVRIAYANRRAHEIHQRPDLTALPVEERGRFHLYADGAPYQPETMPVWRALHRGETVLGEEMVLSRPDGSQRVLEVYAAPVRGCDGAIEMAVVAFQDITERKAVEGALREAHRRKDEFLAMLGHELRNPLAAICSAVHLMKAHAGGDPVLARVSATAERQAAQMARLLDDLLEAARVVQGKIALKLDDVDLAEVVRSAAETAGPLIQERRHRLSLLLPQAPLVVHGDPVRLAQVVSNLLINAAKYTPPEGEIRLEVRANEGVGEWENGREGEGAREQAQRSPASPILPLSHSPVLALSHSPILPLSHSPAPPLAEIRIRDSGAGIAPDLLPHVFDLFVQGERTPGRQEGGLGVGLTLARSLVEMHGGCVEARSDGPGQGSEFVVWLPLAGSAELPAADARVPAAPASTPHSEGTGGVATVTPGSLRILVVDDNADAAALLAMLLDADGHQVTAVHGGAEALALLGVRGAMGARENGGPGAPLPLTPYRPDVVLLDLGMPGVDGYEVARRLRQDPALARIVIVAVSGYGQDSDRERTRVTGFDAHLVKPVTMDALRHVLAPLREHPAPTA